MKKPFQELVQRWPSSLVARAEVGRFSGGIVSGKSLANLASKGERVPPSLRVSGKIAYRAEDLAAWLEERAK